MAVNDEILDLMLRHQVYIQRLGGGVLRQLIPLLNRADQDIVAELRRRGDALEGSFTSRRLAALLNAIRDINRDANETLGRELRTELIALAEYEAGFNRRLLSSTIPVALDIVSPSAEMLEAVVTARPFQGRLLSEWLSEFEASKTRRVRDAIRLGMVEGQTVDQIVRRVRGTKALGYRDGAIEMSRRGAEAMVRTAVSHTASAARTSLYEQNADIIAKEQVVATLDTRTCTQCASLDKETFEIGKGPQTPFHIGCLPGDALVTSRDRIAGVSKRRFNGQLVVIRTASGKELASTPNHPILTDGGFVSSGLLNIGDNVVCDGAPQGGEPVVDLDHQNVPTRIEDVAEAAFRAFKVVTRPVPTSAEDFHGDGVDGEIAIVASDSFLEDRLDAPLDQHSRQSLFVGGNVGLVPFASEGGLAALFFGVGYSLRGLMRSLYLGTALFLRHALPFEPFRFALSAAGDAVVPQHPSDNKPHEAEMLGDGVFGGAANVHVDDFTFRDNGGLEGARSHFNAPVFEPSDNSIGAYTDLASDILAGTTGPVLLDQIVHIERRDFSDHVFNLETENGFYIANGIITHNCRCVRVPVTKSWRELGFDIDDLPPGTRASMNGQVPASLSYGEWLRRQPARVQNDALGATRGKLFREGGLDVEKFVNRNGDEITLDQLRRIEERAFEKAGIAA